MAEKTDSFSFRSPGQLRRAIERAAEYQGKNRTQFMLDAAKKFIDRMADPEAKLSDFLLPDGFEIPKDDPRMVTFRVSPEAIQLIKDNAPRFYHSATKLVLWASTMEIYECKKEADARKKT